MAAADFMAMERRARKGQAGPFPLAFSGRERREASIAESIADLEAFNGEMEAQFLHILAIVRDFTMRADGIRRKTESLSRLLQHEETSPATPGGRRTKSPAVSMRLPTASRNSFPDSGGGRRGGGLDEVAVTMVEFLNPLRATDEKIVAGIAELEEESRRLDTDIQESFGRSDTLGILHPLLERTIAGLTALGGETIAREMRGVTPLRLHAGGMPVAGRTGGGEMGANVELF